MFEYKTTLSCAVLTFFIFFSAGTCAAEGLIEAVSFHGENSQHESVTFTLNGEVVPNVFALGGEKPRVVLDFPGTRIDKSVPSAIDAKGEIVRKVRFGRYSKKARAVIDLQVGKEVDFDQRFDMQTNVLTVRLFPVGTQFKDEDLSTGSRVAGNDQTVDLAAPVASVESEKLEAVVRKEPDTASIPDKEQVESPGALGGDSKSIPTDTGALLVDVSFENTSNKGEMVLFKLNGFYPPTVEGKEEGNPLVLCEFTGVYLGEKVVKEQVVHGEYVERFRVEQVDGTDVLRVTIQLVSGSDYDLQQVFFKEDNLFVLIVNSYDFSKNAGE